MTLYIIKTDQVKFKISICHPDDENIETLVKTFSSKEAQDFFEEYPWTEQLELLDKMNQDDVQYSPSVRFTNTANNISLEMTAESKDGNIFFSLWFERPVMTKILFGLLGEKEKMKLIEKWGFDHSSSKKHLESFLNQKYNDVERVMNQ